MRHGKPMPPRDPLAPRILAAAVFLGAAAVQPSWAEEPYPPSPEPASPPASASPAAAVPGVDDRDLLELFGLRSRDAGSVPPPQNKVMGFVVPVFSGNPAVGLALGVAGTAAVVLGPREETTASSATASAMWTTKHQFLGSVKSVVLTARNEWELLGDLRFYQYSEPTYGLGTAATPVSGGFVLNGIDTAALPGGQPLDFGYVKVHQTAFRRVVGSWYGGVGYHLDLHKDIQDELLDLAAPQPVVTSHYAYSKVEGFDPTRYCLSGVSLNALYESRDHTLEPHRGTYLHLAYRIHPTWLGSSQSSTKLYAEFRTYVSLTARPRHLLAVWLLAEAVASGAVPYLDLPALGYDTRGRSGRGYAAGRFRGTALVYGEVEYRFPLTRNGILGGVAFLNGTTASRPRVELPGLGVSDPGVALFQAVKPGAGLGLRITADRRARMNLALDWGMGAGGLSGVYLALGEAF